MEASSTAADHGSSIAAGDEPHVGEGGPATQTSTQPEGEPTGDVFRGTEAGQEAVQEDDLVGAVHNLGRMSLPLEWRVAELRANVLNVPVAQLQEAFVDPHLVFRFR